MTIDIFVHIPKCAGTSLRSLVAEAAGVRLMHVPGGMHDLGELTSRMTSLPVRDGAVLWGHIPFGSCPHAGDIRYSTILREPLDRAVSAYHYAAERSQNYARADALELGFVEFLRKRVALGLDNQQVRYVAGVAPDRPVTPRDVAEAQDLIVSRYACVGLFDEVDTFAERLGALLRIGPMGRVPRVKPTSSRPATSAAPHEWGDVVAELFWADVELYGFVRDLVATRTGRARTSGTEVTDQVGRMDVDGKERRIAHRS